MKEIVKVKLENEMDLILAHKRAMKLCELCGLSLIAQTSIATAVSEIARCAIEFGKSASLLLVIDGEGPRKVLKAIITDPGDFLARGQEACQYARRLVDEVELVRGPRDFRVVLKQQLAFAGTLTDARIQGFTDYFRHEPPLSPYDELRRKNLLLQDLAEKLRESEAGYQVLTDSLPLMMFAATNRGAINYGNRWLQHFLGGVPRELTSAAWLAFMHTEDHIAFTKDLSVALQRQAPLSGQYRFREKATGNFLWHILSMIPLKNDKDITIRWIGFVVDVNAHKLAEQALKDNKELRRTQTEMYAVQQELQQKVIELNQSNYELEQFAHLATHDLQEPLRKLFFYTDVLKKKYAERIDASGLSMLNNMTASAARMRELINDLLSYSQLQRQQIVFDEVSLDGVMAEIVKELDLVIREKNAVIDIAALPAITGNELRLRQLFTNLLSNALKYSHTDRAPRIEVTVQHRQNALAIIVKDNGIGFDEKFREKIFGLFERLHTRNEFPGTGIGLSICKRIAELHQGSISATARPNEYAMFEVVLPTNLLVTPLENAL